MDPAAAGRGISVQDSEIRAVTHPPSEEPGDLQPVARSRLGTDILVTPRRARSDSNSMSRVLGGHLDHRVAERSKQLGRMAEQIRHGRCPRLPFEDLTEVDIRQRGDRPGFGPSAQLPGPVGGLGQQRGRLLALAHAQLGDARGGRITVIVCEALTTLRRLLFGSAPPGEQIHGWQRGRRYQGWPAPIARNPRFGPAIRAASG